MQPNFWLALGIEWKRGLTFDPRREKVEIIPQGPLRRGFEFKPYSIVNSAVGINEAISSSLTPRAAAVPTHPKSHDEIDPSPSWNGRNICHAKTGPTWSYASALVLSNEVQARRELHPFTLIVTQFIITRRNIKFAILINFFARRYWNRSQKFRRLTINPRDARFLSFARSFLL